MNLRTALLLLLSASSLSACGTFLLPHPADYPPAERIQWDTGNNQFIGVTDAQGRWMAADSSAHVPPGFRDPPPPPPPPKE